MQEQVLKGRPGKDLPALGRWQLLPSGGADATLLLMAPSPDITSMNVSLPRDQKHFVDERVTTGGFASVSDYVRELIRRDQREQSQEEIERRLLAALESPRSEMTPQDWKELRDGLMRRHPKPDG